jgi:hypothetical protein
MHAVTRAAGPLYVSRANEQAFAPPYRQAGCSLYAFPIPASRAKLQQIVDRFLADPTDGRVQPRVDADHVLLYFCEFAQSQSHDPVDAQRGWLGERECGVWIPLRVAGASVPAFFAHVMFVDSGPAMCSGREVLGFPKEIGLLHVPQDPADAAVLSLTVLVTGEGRSQPGSWRPLIELERRETRSGSGGETMMRWTELLGVDVAIGGPLRRITRALQAIARAAGARADFYNLKQFRDCADPRRACYQAVIRARAGLVAARRVASAGDYAYRIHECASHPIADELGLPPSGCASGLFIDLDLDFERGEVL